MIKESITLLICTGTLKISCELVGEGNGVAKSYLTFYTMKVYFLPNLGQTNLKILNFKEVYQMRKLPSLIKHLLAITILSFWSCTILYAIGEDEVKNLQVLNDQLQERANLFEATLELFSMPSPKEVANTWAEGIKTRNGTMQYAVMSNKLKETFKQETEGNPAWVTGVSSPYVTEYKLAGIKNISPIQKDVTVEFHWATATGEEPATESTLSIIKNNGKWSIYTIEEK